MQQSATDRYLASIKQQVKATEDNMEMVRGRFLRATERFLAAEYQAQFDAALNKRGKKVLLPEEIPAARRDLQLVLQSLSSTVQQVLNDNELWTHRTGCGDDDRPGRYEMYGTRPPFFLADTVRRLFTPLGIFLLDTKLVDPLARGVWDRDKDGLPLYNVKIDWSAEMRREMERYSLLYNKWFELAREYEQVKAQQNAEWR